MSAWADCAACGGRDTYLDLEDEEYRLRCNGCGELTTGTTSGPTQLHECPVCGAVGLRERITDHDCQAFLERRGERR